MIEITSHLALRVVGPRLFGRQQAGYPPAGPADHFSATRSNLALYNQGDATVLEWDIAPLRVIARADCRLVVGGCPRDIQLNGQAVRRYAALQLHAGDVLEVGPARGGVIGYIAMEGGIQQAADGCFVALRAAAVPPSFRVSQPWSQLGAWAPAKGILRCLPGPEWQHDFLDLLPGPWRMTSLRDRQGIRLAGPALPSDIMYDIPSAPLVDGTVQLDSRWADYPHAR